MFDILTILSLVGLIIGLIARAEAKFMETYDDFREHDNKGEL